MKKPLILFLSLILILSLSSCEDVINILLEDDSTEEPSTADGAADENTDDDSGTDMPETDLETSALRSSIIALAREQIGIEYLYGGSLPSTGFDCSGFCYYCYGQNGITLPRTSKDQFAGGTNVGLSGAKFGDIIAFYSPVSHVGMITSSTTFIHSPSTGRSVEEESLEGYYSEHLAGVSSYIDN